MTALSQASLKQYRERLRARRDELREAVRQGLLNTRDESYAQLAGRVHDYEDESVAELIMDLNLAELDREAHELYAVEQALVRIDGGSFGICVDCSEPIADKRLEAYPTAERCIECQERYEHEQRGTRHSTM